MIRHVAVFRWAEGVTAEQVAEVSAALDAMPGQVPEIRSYTHGPNVQPAPGRWDYAVVADFDDLAGWRAYDEDPEHARVRSDVIIPITAERTNLQLDLG
ncbi:MAG TPA: Dabb family protein [Acidimicrobiales bacterium]